MTKSVKYYEYDEETKLYNIKKNNKQKARPNNQNDPDFIKEVVRYQKKIKKKNPKLEYTKTQKDFLEKYKRYEDIKSKIESLENKIRRHSGDEKILNTINDYTIKLGNPTKDNPEEEIQKTLDKNVKKLKEKKISKTIDKYEDELSNKRSEQTNELKDNINELINHKKKETTYVNKKKKYKKDYKEYNRYTENLQDEINKYSKMNFSNIFKKIDKKTIKSSSPMNDEQKNKLVGKINKKVDNYYKNKSKKKRKKKSVNLKKKLSELIDDKNKLRGYLKYKKLENNIGKDIESLKEKISNLSEQDFCKIFKKIDNQKITSIESSKIKEKLKKHRKELTNKHAKKSSSLKNMLKKLIKFKATFWGFVKKTGEFSLKKCKFVMAHGISIKKMMEFITTILNYPKHVLTEEMKNNIFNFIKHMQTTEQRQEDELKKEMEGLFKDIENNKSSEKLIKRASKITKMLNACPKNITPGDPALNSNIKDDYDAPYMYYKGKNNRLKLPKHAEVIKEDFEKVPQIGKSSSAGKYLKVGKNQIKIK